MKKNKALHKILSLTLMLSVVGLFTACGCGRSTVDENNNTTNTPTESGINGGSTNNGNGSTTSENTTESGMFNGSMGNDNVLGTDGMVDSTTNGTDEGIVGGVVDDIVGDVTR